MHPHGHQQTGGWVLLTLPLPSSRQEKGSDIPVVLGERVPVLHGIRFISQRGDEMEVMERSRMGT